MTEIAITRWELKYNFREIRIFLRIESQQATKSPKGDLGNPAAAATWGRGAKGIEYL
jgi:hypothetical protein